MFEQLWRQGDSKHTRFWPAEHGRQPLFFEQLPFSCASWARAGERWTRRVLTPR